MNTNHEIQELMRERVSNGRIHELAMYYEALANSPHGARSMVIEDNRHRSDAQHVSIMRELLLHRQYVCDTCEGRGWVENPDARYEEDRGPHGQHTGVYSTNDLEDIDCPTCRGVGYVKPKRPEPNTPFVVTKLDGEVPF